MRLGRGGSGVVMGLLGPPSISFLNFVLQVGYVCNLNIFRRVGAGAGGDGGRGGHSSQRRQRMAKKGAAKKETHASLARFNSDDDSDSPIPVVAVLPRKKPAKPAASAAASGAASQTAAIPAKPAKAVAPAHASAALLVPPPRRAAPGVAATTPAGADDSAAGAAEPRRGKPAKRQVDVDGDLKPDWDGDLDIVADDATPSAEADEDESDEDGDEEFTNVTFEFFDPIPDDFWSVEHFLRDFVDDAKDFPAQQLAQVVANQVMVGTMVKTGADDYPIGFITALNVSWHRTQPAVALVLKFLTAHCLAPRKQATLQALLRDAATHPVGLILQDRVINMPLELIPPLHQALLDDVAFAVQNETTPAERDAFKFEHYIIIGRIFHADAEAMASRAADGRGNEDAEDAEDAEEAEEADEADEAPPNKKAKTAEAATLLNDDGKDVTFIKFEEECYRNHASLVFTCPVFRINAASAYADVPQARLVMVVPASRMPKVVAEITALVKEYV